MLERIGPGATVGILGGGQLGRMLAIAAARLGLHAHIFEPGDAPAAEVARAWTRAGFDDVEALRGFAEACDVVTYEWENVPVSAVDAVDVVAPVRPGRQALEAAQDRLAEKDFLSGQGLRVAPYAPVERAGDLESALERVGPRGILKTRRMGYDGKGQARFEGLEAAREALLTLGGAPAIAEGLVTFEREISVIAARGLDGAVSAFDPGENVHRDGILHTTTVPARVRPGLLQDAVLIAGRILGALDYVGVIGVELFVTADGLVVNEIAPRVHNSGHWTLDACLIDQFEQHIRAICGWPLGDGSRHSDAVMVNLIGDEVVAAPPAEGAAVHLYGKAEARPGRKMGHLTRLLPKGSAANA